MATEETKHTAKEAHKWTPEQVRHLIKFRVDNEDKFTQKKHAAKQLWGTLIEELGLKGKVNTHQASKKWENLKKKYKDLKTPKTGSGTESGETTAATWAYYNDMHAALGSRPSIEPLLLVASFEDPTTILMSTAEEYSACSEETKHAAKEAHKWTPEQVRHLIKFRVDNEDKFTKKKHTAKQLWGTLIEELGLGGKVNTQQVSKKWENLKKKYKDLKTGSGTESGETTAATWAYYNDMHAALGSRPSIEPLLLVASFEDPTTILMNIVEPHTPSTSNSEPSTPSTAEENSVSTSTSASMYSRAATPPARSRPTPEPISPSPKRKRKNPFLDFWKQEAEKEQRRHEESEAKMDRFLDLFQQLIDKMP